MWIKQKDLGELYTDRARVSCPDAGLSVEPDLVAVLNRSFRLDRGRNPQGRLTFDLQSREPRQNP